MTDQERIQQLESIVNGFIRDYEAVGPDAVQDIDWYDLHILYRDACSAMSIAPEEPAFAWDCENFEEQEDDLG
jgi:hypothetical protein